VKTEALMIASVQILKRLLRWCGRGLKPASGMVVSLTAMHQKPSVFVRITVWIEVLGGQRRDCRLILRPTSAL
jgi:hypothetical protein